MPAATMNSVLASIPIWRALGRRPVAVAFLQAAPAEVKPEEVRQILGDYRTTGVCRARDDGTGIHLQSRGTHPQCGNQKPSRTRMRSTRSKARLPVVSKSIQKRDPPEPDTLCQMENGDQLAFELVEICHPRNAVFFGSAPALAGLIEKAYQSLPSKIKARFDERFVNTPLSFEFRSDVSRNRIGARMLGMLSELANQAVRGGGFAVFPIDGQCGFGGLEGFADGPVALGAKMIVVGKAGVEHRVFLGLGHGVEFAFVVVAQTDVFHVLLLPMGAGNTAIADFSVTVSSNEARRIPI
jgi:hypothetical protein